MEKKLTNEQISAINTTDGIICLSAGPGCGKTFVLVRRYVYLLRTLIDENYTLDNAISSILAVTFTKKAAREMRERLRVSLEDFEYNGAKLDLLTIESLMRKMKISTIDSWATTFLREYSFVLGIDSAFKVLDPASVKMEFYAQSKKVMSEFNVAELSALGDFDAFIDDVYKFILVLKSRLVSVKDFFDKTNLAKKDELDENYLVKKCIYEIYNSYEQFLFRNNFMDFSSLLLNVYKIISASPDILKDYAAKLRYILVDEYQDTNDAQDKVLRMISSAIPGCENYFIVGDVGQSIYSFRNANYQNMLAYKKEKAEYSLNLSTNFRSTEIIIDFINKFFDTDNSYFQRINHPGNNDTSDKISLILSDTKNDDAKNISKKVRSLLDEGYMPGDIKILFRSMTNVWDYAKALDEFNIPFAVFGNSEFFKQKEIRDVLAFMKILINPMDDIMLVRVLKSPMFGFTDDDLIFIRRSSEYNESIFTTLLNIVLDENINNDLKNIARLCLDYINVFSNYISRFSILEIFESILSYDKFLVNYDQYSRTLSHIEYLKTINNLEIFRRIIEKYQNENVFLNMSDFFEYLEVLENGISDFIDDDIMDSKRVALMTIHQSKGLEFPVVVVPAVTNGVFPTRNIQNKFHFREDIGFVLKDKNKDSLYAGIKDELDYEHLEEEKRIFYVAVSRAKQKLILSGYKSHNKFGDFLTQLIDEDKIKDTFDELVFLEDMDAEKYAKLSKLVSDVPENISNESDSKKLYDECDVGREIKMPDFYSVSSLELYNKCPYAYYLKYVLHIPEMKILDGDTTDPAKFGTLVHKFLEEQLMNKYDEKTAKDLFLRIMKLMDIQFLPIFDDKFSLMYENISKSISTNVRKSLVEKNFVLNINGYFVRGTIDRIDVLDDNFVNIIDYKTGLSVHPEHYDLSLNIYANAVLQIPKFIDGLDNIKINEIFLVYPFLQNNNLSKIDFDSNLCNRLLNIIESINTDISTQKFEKKCNEDCRYCPYKDLYSDDDVD